MSKFRNWLSDKLRILAYYVAPRSKVNYYVRSGKTIEFKTKSENGYVVTLPSGYEIDTDKLK